MTSLGFLVSMLFTATLVTLVAFIPLHHAQGRDDESWHYWMNIAEMMGMTALGMALSGVIVWMLNFWIQLR